MKQLINSKLLLQVVMATMAATLVTAGIVAASTTIGTNINTGGTLDVTGASTLTGNTTIAGTLGVTGKTTVVNASSTLLSISGQTWLNGNANVAAGKGLVLGSSATAITGSAGMIYYDSGSAVIKLHDGSAWYTVGTSTDGMTLSGSKVQFSDQSYFGTIGTTTQQGLSVLTVYATSSAAIPLTIVANGGQTANLLQIMNGSQSNLLSVSSGGNLTVDTDSFYVGASTDRVGIGTTTPFGTLSIDTNAGDRAFVIGSSTRTLFTIDDQMDLDYYSNLLFGDYSANRVGIATNTPFGTFSINTQTGVTPFVVGSSTATWFKIDESGVLTQTKAATFLSTTEFQGNASTTGSNAIKTANITSDTGAISFGNENLTTTGNIALATASSTGLVKVGQLTVASTTPFTGADLSLGRAGATTTIATGRFCQYIEDQIGRKYWVTINLEAAGPTDSIFATSTTPCN